MQENNLTNQSNHIIEKELTDSILKLFYKVHYKLVFGFLKKVYKNALFLELINAGFKCETEKAINVFYNKKVVGQFFCGYSSE